VAKLPAFRRRHCRDARMLDTLRLAAMGFPEKGPNKYNTPGSLTAAVAVGMKLAVSPENICKSLAGCRNMEGRQEIYEKNGFTIIQDCYNAGPESMVAALNVLGNRSGRRVAVLGDMLELGVCSDAEHYKIGRVAAEKADVLLAFGSHSLRLLYGAITGGMPQNKARAFTDKEKLVQVLKQLAKPGDVLLFKGSRGMRMEEVLEKFLEEEK